MEQTNGFAVFAAMLGVDASVLRVVARPWIEDGQTAPITFEDFAKRVGDLQGVAAQLNNTNQMELAIREALPPEEVPPSLPTAGVPRLASSDDGKEET